MPPAVSRHRSPSRSPHVPCEALSCYSALLVHQALQLHRGSQILPVRPVPMADCDLAPGFEAVPATQFCRQGYKAASPPRTSISAAVEAKVQAQMQQRRAEALRQRTGESAAFKHADSTHIVPRVFPLLCHELMTCCQTFRRLNLHAFLLHFTHLPLVVVTSEDALDLLVVLFHIIEGPGTTADPLQVQRHSIIADLAFQCLCRLLTPPHMHYAVVLGALKQLCKKLGVTEEDWYQRPPPVPPKLSLAQQIIALKYQGKAESVSAVSTSVSVVAARQRENTKIYFKRVEARNQFIELSTPHLQTLSEKEFLRRRRAFQEFDVGNVGSISIDNLMVAGEKIGNYSFSVDMFKGVARQERDSITFLEVMLAWFPSIPLNVLEAYDAQAGVEPVHPDDEEEEEAEEEEPLTELLCNPAAESLKRSEVVFLRTKYLEVVSERSVQRLTLPDLMAAEEMIAGNAFTKDMFMGCCVNHGVNGGIMFKDVLREWFPLIDEENLQRYTLMSKHVAEVAAAAQSPPGSPHSVRSRKSEAAADDLAETVIRLPVPHGDGQWVTPTSLRLTRLLERPETRFYCHRLLSGLDLSGVFIFPFMEPQHVHVYFPQAFTRRAKVFRDFITCPRRPRQPRRAREGPQAWVHIKTNIGVGSKTMYRFLVEGYNYGMNSAIRSEIVGCTPLRGGADRPGPHGYPEGWDSFSAVDHAKGAEISQYFSTDGYVVILLMAESFFNVGFGVSAWLVHHGFGADQSIAATIYHQDDRL
uniref:Uncharacterized protein n=1 Tax=Eutreptiella gymnastica TaxID=73025 RepID=A0A7S1I2V7_9EUGL